jgi:hypothetical protein
VEQNPDNALGLTLDTLGGEAFIDRAQTAPLPKLQAALAAATGRESPDR